jgi:NlpC/P60 family protein
MPRRFCVAALVLFVSFVAGGFAPAGADVSLPSTTPAPATPATPPAPPAPPATTPLPTSFWLATPGGNVWNFGHAAALGSVPSPPAQPIVGITTTPDHGGYWLVGSDGGIFAFGDATFFGSTGALTLNKPIVGMASTPDGGGYWFVASDGGVFSFGDAAFYGSTGALRLSQPIIGMTASTDGGGYWLLGADGGVFNFGSAAFAGSTAGVPGLDPAEKIVTGTAGSSGYWIMDQNGTAHGFGDVKGSPPAQALMFRQDSPGDAAVLFAFAQLGKPYVWGGNGPDGYDCSGLALASWKHAAGVTFARVANDQYHTAGTPVALTDLQAGDLVFWGNDQTDWTSVYHTAMYVGGGRIVEATGDHVQLNSLGQWGTGDLMPNGRRP